MSKRILLVAVPCALAVTAACTKLGQDGPGTGGALNSGGTGWEVTWGNGGEGSTGGSGGWPSVEEGSGGWGGSSWEAGWGGQGGAGPGEYEVIVADERRVITDMAVTATHLYWLTYGTTSLVTGKYNLDGAMHRRELEGGPIETVVDELEGPSRFHLTTEDAYIWLTESTATTKNAGLRFGRVSLEGGTLEPVDAGENLYYLRSFENHVYGYNESAESGTVLELIPGEEPRLVLESGGYGLSFFVVDGSHVYYQDSSLIGTFRMPLEGGTPEQLSSLWIGFDIAPELSTLVGAVPVVDGVTSVVRMPTSGGNWELIAELQVPPSTGVSSPEVAGDRWLASYYMEVDGVWGQKQYVGDIEGGDPVQVPDILTECDHWALSDAGVFRADSRTILRIPID